MRCCITSRKHEGLCLDWFVSVRWCVFDSDPTSNEWQFPRYNQPFWRAMRAASMRLRA